MGKESSYFDSSDSRSRISAAPPTRSTTVDRDVEGALVTDVKALSPAGKANFRSGDVIIKVDDQWVKDRATSRRSSTARRVVTSGFPRRPCEAGIVPSSADAVATILPNSDPEPLAGYRRGPSLSRPLGGSDERGERRPVRVR
ncbi:MAG: PDZ domain-containing protein [Candidatus Eisenbacteria bacterium]